MNDKLLKKIGKKIGVSEEFDLNLVKGKFKLVSIKKGQTFIHSGILVKESGYIQEGLLRLYFENIDGKSSNKNFCMAGNFVGDLNSIIYDIPASFSIDALEDSKIWVIANSVIRKCATNSKSWKEAINRMFGEQLNKAIEKEKLLLSCSPSERFNRLYKIFPDIVANVPQKHIASYLGITPEALSRMRSKNRL